MGIFRCGGRGNGRGLRPGNHGQTTDLTRRQQSSAEITEIAALRIVNAPRVVRVVVREGRQPKEKI